MITTQHDHHTTQDAINQNCHLATHSTLNSKTSTLTTAPSEHYHDYYSMGDQYNTNNHQGHENRNNYEDETVERSNNFSLERKGILHISENEGSTVRQLDD